jgi:ABC-type glycerol-3-phosphate transport system substrate-binding protein
MPIDGKKRNAPYTYYQWGPYYRKDVIAELGVKPAKTWGAFLARLASGLRRLDRGGAAGDHVFSHAASLHRRPDAGRDQGVRSGEPSRELILS